MDGKQVMDSRFEVCLKDFGDNETRVPAVPRSSDGQLLFLMEMVSKMKTLTASPLGSRIASVHNGSSLFTGDAGSGESNIRRYIIENDLLEAVIQLPNNLFYNTGITTYIWVLSNNKSRHRRQKVQLIDTSKLFRKLRKNLGAKNCEFAPKHIEKITRLYLDIPDDGISRIFDNSDFGYHKVTIERPARRAAQFTSERIVPLRFAHFLSEEMAWAYKKWGDGVYDDLAGRRKTIEDHLEKEEINLTAKNRKALFSPKLWADQKKLLEAARALMKAIGQKHYRDFNRFKKDVDTALKDIGIRLSTSEKNRVLQAVSWRNEEAEKVVKKVHKIGTGALEQLQEKLKCEKEHLPDYGYWPGKKEGDYIEYEPDSDLRDYENIPLKKDIHHYFLKEVRPHVPDAWMDMDKTRIGYEISFNKYFYKHKPLRTLEEVTADILKLEAETEGLLKKLVSFGKTDE